MNEEANDVTPKSDGGKSQTAQSSDNSEAVAESGKKSESLPKKETRPWKKPKQKTTARLFLDLMIKIGAITLAVWVLFTFVLSVHIHYGNNMHPSVRDGDLLFGFRLQRPYINAAVIYEHDGKTTVGRVIAMEGSVIDIADNGVFTVNGSVPPEEVFYPTYRAQDSQLSYPYTVPSGMVFILNDFREDVSDSRSFGAVDADDLKGPLLFSMRRRGF